MACNCDSIRIFGVTAADQLHRYGEQIQLRRW
jgi:hypothetical protein